MPKPIYDLPGSMRRAEIFRQIAAFDSDTVDLTYRRTDLSQPVTREFVLQGVSDPLDSGGRAQLILTDPHDDHRMLTIPFSAVGALDTHDDEGDCEGHESTAGPIGNVIYCDGSCKP